MSFSLAKYESFLINNVSTISSLESSLRSITWFLPGRFKDAELASEALTALMNTMSMYHDTVLAKVVENNPKHRPLIPSSLHTRYTKAWIGKSSQYKWAARALELLRFTELVIEMGLRRKVSEKVRWRGIVIIEVIKAVLRLLILKVTRRPVLSPPLPERDFDPIMLPPSSVESSPTLAPSSPAASLPTTPDHLKNNYLSLPPHPLLTAPPPPMRSDTAVEDFLLPKALTTSSVKPSLTLLKTLSAPQDWLVEDWLVEVIHVLRPLIYASLLAYDRQNKQHTNRALVTALVLEFISRNLRRAPPPSALLERSEYARRDKDMLWYLLRGSIWESYTRPKLESFVTSASRAPLLGLFGVLVKEWIPLIDEYYYYTAP
ncbi:Peroxisomal membrane protein PEX16 [Leucoagaricus sp. SymC.cos]|nr:Peroxisomal membrane protein PEX16 [Leucoagaricus sp. SymC.cos]